MPDPIVSIQNLGKSYLIGHQVQSGDGLRHVIENAIRSPLRWLSGNRQKRRSVEEFWALKNVTFDIQKGEVVGIIGRNGAGKSTLLKLLSRITEPTEGRVILRGRVSSLLEVGTGFHPELTGRENVYLNGAILGMSRQEIRRKFDEIIAFADIEKFLDTPVKRYSSGMYVRLAFAVAAHLEPEILIVDEVLAVGDTEFQKKCLGKMESVAKGGRTVLFVSHNMTTISSLCNRAVMLHKGKVMADGPTEQVIEHYLTEIRSRAKVSAGERTDRGGSGDVRTTGIEALDLKDRALRQGISGKPLKLRLSYRCAEGKRVPNCNAVLVIRHNDRVICVFSTALVRPEPLKLSGEGHIDFIIPKLPLAGGLYTIGVLIESDGAAADVLFGASELDVIDGDFFGTGRVRPTPRWKDTGVLVEHQCEIHGK